MEQVYINYWSVLAAAIVQMLLGYIWYLPSLFGNAWLHSLGYSAEKLEELKKRNGIGGVLGLAFLVSLISAFVLAHFVEYFNATNLGTAIQTAFWVWLGFVVTSNMNPVLWEKRSWTNYVINMGYILVSYGVMTWLLAAW